MFDSVNHLAYRLPQPEWTGDPANDRRAIEQYIANGKRLRSEAFRAFWVALAAFVRGIWRQGSAPIGGAASHQH
jgi:hypothetical protein